MPNYKRIYKENETEGQDVIGYIKPNETVRVVKNLTPQQIAIINQKDELKEHCRELGGFIHVCYVKNELLFNNLNLTRPTITRLIYLATYIDYNNRDSNLLVKYGKNHKLEPLKKKDIENLMKLSNPSFLKFFNEIKEKGILFEDNKKYYLSNKYFSKGQSIYKKKEYTRIFIDSTRFFYQNSTSRQHTQLSYVFQLIPFLHYETNILCRNPDELDIDNLDILSLRDICELLKIKTSYEQMSRVENSLLKFKLIFNNKKYHLFKRIIVKGEDEKVDYFITNPLLIWKGNDVDKNKETIEKLYFSNKNNKVSH
jgi:hypothetical protein